MPKSCATHPKNNWLMRAAPLLRAWMCCPRRGQIIVANNLLLKA